MKLFSGTANLPLAQKVSKILDLPISSSEVVRFDNSEVRVRIEDDVRGETAVVIQPTANPSGTNLMELFFFCDALHRQEARRVIAVIPYFGYARQNIQHRPGECVSVNVIVRFLEALRIAKVYAFDLHDEATEGVFSIPFKHATAFDSLANRVKEYVGHEVNDDTVAVVSPDQGGIERARHFADYFFEKAEHGLTVIEKKRNLESPHSSRALSMYGNIEGKTAIIVDDIVTSAGTLINAADLCIQKGAKRVIAAISHHDFSEKAPSRIQESAIEKFFTTDSLYLRPEQKFDKLEEITIAPRIADEISRFKKD